MTTLFQREENFNGFNVPVKAEFHQYRDATYQYVVVTFSDSRHNDFKRFFNPLVEIKDMRLVSKFLYDTRIVIGANTRLTGYTEEDASIYAELVVEELHRMLTLKPRRR